MRQGDNRGRFARVHQRQVGVEGGGGPSGWPGCWGSSPGIGSISGNRGASKSPQYRTGFSRSQSTPARHSMLNPPPDQMAAVLGSTGRVRKLSRFSQMNTRRTGCPIPHKKPTAATQNPSASRQPAAARSGPSLG